jgi:Leucine-rich repeat (LRR) protein
MENLVLSANLLVGDLPTCIGKMTSLKELRISGNFLDGSLPGGFHDLSSLQRLSFDFNNFGGSIKALFSEVQERDLVFPNLQILNLHNNNLSGSIPDLQLASMTNLRTLTMDDNPGLFGSMNAICSVGFVREASADCDQVSCHCCSSGNNCSE